METKDVSFDDIDFRDLFIAHGTLWIKISHTAAQEYGNSRHGSCCNFAMDGKPEDNNMERVQALPMNEVKNIIMAVFHNE